MFIPTRFLACRPIFQTVISTTIFAASSQLLLGCLSLGVRSTGAILPQPSTTMESDAVRIVVDHDCSNGRCSGFEASFENRLDEELEILVGGIKVVRAGEHLGAVHNAEAPQSSFVLQPKEKLSVDFLAVDSKKRTPMTYVRPTGVWCSLKVNSQCANPARGEAECGAFARAYFQQHVDLKGWTQTVFSVKAKSWKKAEDVSSEAPQFLANKPAVALSEDVDSPFWFGPRSQHTVFYRFECDANCGCAPIEKPRDFMADDKFLPVEKKK